jgi:hypothetical protein
MSQSDSRGVPENLVKLLKNNQINTKQQYDKIFQENMMLNQFKNLLTRIETLNGKHKVFIPWIVLENKNIYEKWFI